MTGSVSSATAVRIRTTDVGRTTGFLTELGFELVADAVLRSPGADPSIELIPTDRPPRPVQGFDRGPRALDIYTTDVDAAVARLGAAGWRVSGPGTLSAGPVTMRQALVDGPDGLPVVLVESTHRRTSLLDEHPDRLYSEPHSVVWAVDDLDGEAERWISAGWTAGPTISFSEPAVSEYLELPRSPVPIRMVMLSDAAVTPVRLELLEFPDDPGTRIDRPAISELVVVVDDPPTVTDALELRDGCTPGGVQVQLRRAD